MKKAKKSIIIAVTLLAFAIIISNTSKVMANPNSSRGFAEYDDATAEEEAKKMEEEQQFDFEKSTDNFLESLEVEGYEITPEFDKQTLEYTIEKEVKEENISIKATPSNEKASIEGIGEIALKAGKNKYRIDVTAEFGTVRTYWITINRAGTEEEIRKTEEEKEEEEKRIYGEEPSEPEVIGQDNGNQKALIIGIAMGVIFSIICVSIVAKLKRKGKH